MDALAASVEFLLSAENDISWTRQPE